LSSTKVGADKVINMTRNQKIVGIGAASGVAAMIAAVAGIYQLWPTNPNLADAISRLAYVLQANAFAVIPLLLGIITVGNDRFVSEAIDPTLQKEDLATQINGRVVENTLQQSVLFLVATTALSVNLTSTQMRIIPAAAIVFVVARIAFWIGYRIHPLYRAFGMAATGYLNVGLLGFALWKASSLGS
jgi:predicted nicotinamide N-methyase